MPVPHRRSLFLLVAVALLIAPAAFANHAWSTYHWGRTANPFTLKVGNNVTSIWTSQFNTATADWTASSVMNLNVVAGTSSKRCSAVAGTVQVCNNRYGNNGWLGLAQIWLSGSHISQGIAKMNDTYFNTSTYNNPNEKLHVMCQEIGHTFGLDHQSTDGSSQNTCMDYFSNTGANAGSTLSTRPNQHDYDQLAAIYAHLDSTSTVGTFSAARGAGIPAVLLCHIGVVRRGIDLEAAFGVRRDIDCRLGALDFYGRQKFSGCSIPLTGRKQNFTILKVD